MLFKAKNETTSICLDGEEFAVKDGMVDIPSVKDWGTLERIHGIVPATAEEISAAKDGKGRQPDDGKGRQPDSGGDK